jgi:hypothetical protein
MPVQTATEMQRSSSSMQGHLMLSTTKLQLHIKEADSGIKLLQIGKGQLFWTPKNSSFNCYIVCVYIAQSTTVCVLPSLQKLQPIACNQAVIELLSASPIVN